MFTVYDWRLFRFLQMGCVFVDCGHRDSGCSYVQWWPGVPSPVKHLSDVWKSKPACLFPYIVTQQGQKVNKNNKGVKGSWKWTYEWFLLQFLTMTIRCSLFLRFLGLFVPKSLFPSVLCFSIFLLPGGLHRNDFPFNTSPHYLNVCPVWH